jgi:hypothetical protein
MPPSKRSVSPFACNENHMAIEWFTKGSRMKMMKVHITLWIVLFAGGFLLGFLPQYLKNRELQRQLESPRKTIDALTLRVQMSEIRDVASLMLLELSRQNYGLARDYSTQYYSKLREAADTAQDPNLKKSLEELASTRDSLTTSLTTADAASLSAAQPIILRTFEVTRNVK